MNEDVAAMLVTTYAVTGFCCAACTLSIITALARLGGTVLRLKYAGSKAYTRSSLLCSSSYEVEATM
jgi:hypothetical protein